MLEVLVIFFVREGEGVAVVDVCVITKKGNTYQPFVRIQLLYTHSDSKIVMYSRVPEL